MAGDEFETPGCLIRSAHLGYYVAGSYESTLELVRAAEDAEPLDLETISIEGHRFRFRLLEPVISVEQVSPERWAQMLRTELENRARTGAWEGALVGLKGMADAAQAELEGGDEGDGG